ncbi:hypothetical protein N657DRAFT_610234 [Parathielavia appendiculata]|uniref:Uncharacterized protein n=1 Tax=Parathielavia appendiculata TaxID=2587402 RepID=A0AAN6UAW9_9PEZI|nr:hypothetical protein N657DRAFT_610234 [Parathielavia appendiculata]
MEIDTGDDVLRKAALDGSMDYSAWPDLLPTVLARIEKIAHTEFPIPAVPPPPCQPARPPSPRFLAPLPSSDPFEAPDQADSPSSQGTNKENVNPSSPSTSRNAAATTSADPAAPATPTLPKPIADMLDEILSVLRTNFPQYPPHTIQRLSELVLSPRQHYRNLVPYLHALDRVVHVTSGANTYPLPPAVPDVGAMSLFANGVSASGPGRLSIDTAAANSVASDEALGGALLTPIPWLSGRANGAGSDDGSDAGSSSPLSADRNTTHTAQQVQLRQQQQQQQQQQRQGAGHLDGRVRTESTESIEGPNGIGSIETVSVSVNGVPSTGAGFPLLTQRSVTQGELLRQEQRAGIVPLNQLTRQRQQAQGAAADYAADEEDASMAEDAGETDDEFPHARGPEEIGPADTGPQSAAAANIIAGGGGSPMDVQAIDVEAAVGRRLEFTPFQQQQPQQQQQQDGVIHSPGGGETSIPRSPKREAADNLEPESPAKRRKDDDEAGMQQDQDQKQSNTNQEADEEEGRNESAGGITPSAYAGSEPSSKPDAEGDLDLPDATTTTTAAKATQSTDPAINEVNLEPEDTSSAIADGDDKVDKEEIKGEDGEVRAEPLHDASSELPTVPPGASDAGAENQGS